MSGLTREERAALRDMLAARHPWLRNEEFGPRAVEAGECDRCGAEARLVTTCGPIAWSALGRRCAAEVGADAWCEGHVEEAERALAWLAGLPEAADHAARLWWVATGEVRLDPELLELSRRVALPE